MRLSTMFEPRLGRRKASEKTGPRLSWRWPYVGVYAGACMEMNDKAEPPNFEDWSALLEVCGQLAFIVDDEPLPESLPASAGGLLGGFFAGVRNTVAANEPRMSRLAAALSRSQPSEWATIEPCEVRLCRLVPGIQSLGADRSARLKALKALLRDQPSYTWLNSQEGYRGALALMRNGKVGKLKPAYAADTAEFKLISAIATALRTFHLAAKHAASGLPSKGDIGKAKEAANALVSFFGQYGLALYASGHLQDVSSLEIRKLAQSLADLHDSGKRLQQSTTLQRATLAQFGLGLREQFGDWSPAVMVKLALLLGYDITETNIVPLMHGAAGSTPKQRGTPAPAIATTSAGGFFGGLASGLVGKWRKHQRDTDEPETKPE